jgi:hypothetical protein
MSGHNLFYYPYASFTDRQLPLLKVAALWFDKLVILDPVGASWDTIGADHVARDAVRQLKDAGILEIVTPATVLAKYERPIADAVRLDMADREFLDLCDAQSQATRKQRWTLSLAKVPQDLQIDQTMRHLMGEFARDVANKAAYAADDYIEHIEATGAERDGHRGRGSSGGTVGFCRASHARSARDRRAGPRVGHGHPGRRMAARLAAGQEERSGEWAALLAEGMNKQMNR